MAITIAFNTSEKAMLNGNWSFQDKCLYSKINYYKTTSNGFILRVRQRNAKRNTKLFHNNTKKYMAQRFKELNKNPICFE